VSAKDVSTYSFEAARDELLTIVGKLEQGEATLDEALELWERGEKLAARCQEILDGARERIAAVRGAEPPADAEEDGE
jgi:exodeoxyribonuclease VII small subunit